AIETKTPARRRAGGVVARGGCEFSANFCAMRACLCATPSPFLSAQAADQRRAILDRLQAHRGHAALDAGHARDLRAQDLIEVRDARHEHVQEIVALARSREALEHRAMADRSRLELRVLRRIDRRVDERMDLEPQLAGVEFGAIALDDAPLFEVAHARPAGGLGQRDLVGELRVGQTGVFFQHPQNSDFSTVQHENARSYKWRFVELAFFGSAGKLRNAEQCPAARIRESGPWISCNRAALASWPPCAAGTRTTRCASFASGSTSRRTSSTSMAIPSAPCRARPGSASPTSSRTSGGPG